MSFLQEAAEEESSLFTRAGGGSSSGGGGGGGGSANIGLAQDRLQSMKDAVAQSEEMVRQYERALEDRRGNTQRQVTRYGDLSQIWLFVKKI